MKVFGFRTVLYMLTEIIYQFEQINSTRFQETGILRR